MGDYDAQAPLHGSRFRFKGVIRPRKRLRYSAAWTFPMAPRGRCWAETRSWSINDYNGGLITRHALDL